MSVRKSKRDLLRMMIEPDQTEQVNQILPQQTQNDSGQSEEDREATILDQQHEPSADAPAAAEGAAIEEVAKNLENAPIEKDDQPPMTATATQSDTEPTPQPATESTSDAIPFSIQPKQKKQPKAVTHTKITTEIHTPLLDQFDNIASHLDYSRAELLEEVIRNFVSLVKKSHPEWAEKPMPRKRRGRK